MSKAALCPLERMCGKDILKQIESYIKLPWFYYFKVEWQFHFYLCLVFLKIVYMQNLVPHFICLHVPLELKVIIMLRINKITIYSRTS